MSEPVDNFELEIPETPSMRIKARGVEAEIGSTGLVRYGTDVDEEFLRALKGAKGMKAIREMRDNDSTIGSSLYVMDALIRQIAWTVQPADHPKGEEAAAFVRECMEDMSHTWKDYVSEVFSMAWFGFSYFEKIYKYRRGASADPTQRSRFTDGKIGWRKFGIRAQESIDGWLFDAEGGIQGMFQRVEPGFKRVLIPIDNSILFRTTTLKNNPEGRSLLRNAYRSWFFLKRLQELEAIGIERDLVGLPMMELPPAFFDQKASVEKKAVVAAYQKIISQIRRNEHEGVVVPSEMDPVTGKPTGFKLSLLSSGGTRAVDASKAIERHEKRIAQTLLTHWLFLGMDGVGSQSLSMDMTSVFTAALSSIADIVEETHHRHATQELILLNGFPIEACPRIKHGAVEKRNLTSFTKVILDLTTSGVIKPDDKLEDFVRAETGLPEKTIEDVNDGDIIGDSHDTVDENNSDDASVSIDQLTNAIRQLAEIGDIDLLNQARAAFAAKLGLPPPAPVTAETIADFRRGNQ